MKKRIVAASTAIVTIGCIFAFIDTAPSGKKEVAAANAETKPVGKENAVERQRNGKVLSTGVDNFKPKNEAELIYQQILHNSHCQILMHRLQIPLSFSFPLYLTFHQILSLYVVTLV